MTASIPEMAILHIEKDRKAVLGIFIIPMDYRDARLVDTVLRLMI